MCIYIYIYIYIHIHIHIHIYIYIYIFLPQRGTFRCCEPLDIPYRSAAKNDTNILCSQMCYSDVDYYST